MDDDTAEKKLLQNSDTLRSSVLPSDFRNHSRQSSDVRTAHIETSECNHRKNIEKYQNIDKEFKYSISVTIPDDPKTPEFDPKQTNVCVLELSFYRYLLFTEDKFDIFEKNLDVKDRETLHQNLFLLFDNIDTVKHVVDCVQSFVNSIASLGHESKDLRVKYFDYIKECLEAVVNIKSFFEHFQFFSLDPVQKGLIIRNLIAYIFCSHTYISSDNKEVFCIIFVPVFDKVWELVHLNTGSCCRCLSRKKTITDAVKSTPGNLKAVHRKHRK